MKKINSYYNEELFSKAIGQENISCPIECNMDEDNIEYYVGDNSYPNKISKEELKLKCKENNVSYDMLIRTNKIDYIERTKNRCLNGFKFGKDVDLKLWECTDLELDFLYNNVKIMLNGHIRLCKMRSGSFSIVLEDTVTNLPDDVEIRDAKEFFTTLVLSNDGIDDAIELI
jgi:hypothetical protein